jgi:hypothetical protein
MFFHLIPLSDLKKHSVTYWRPGRDFGSSADTWVVLAEVESGYLATVLDLPVENEVDRHVPRAQAETMRSQRAEDALALFLRDRGEQLQRGIGSPAAGESVNRARKFGP